MRNKFNTIMVHIHSEGTSIYHFRSEIEYIGWYSEENIEPNEFDELFKKLNADVEFNKNETIEFCNVDDTIIDID